MVIFTGHSRLDDKIDVRQKMNLMKVGAILRTILDFS